MLVKSYNKPLTLIGGGEFSKRIFSKCLRIAPTLIAVDSGLNYFLLIILICIFTDIGGYVFGKIFKGPKLTIISPNKTYSGVVGSFIFSLIAGLIYLDYFGKKEIVDLEHLIILLIILFISLISQIGDLLISYFKRKAKLKDTGKILPGHGGLLDRIDGLIFVMPMIYLLGKI